MGEWTLYLGLGACWCAQRIAQVQITRGERELGVKLNSIVTQSSQSSATTIRVDRCEH